MADELERLIAMINQTNSSTRLPSGVGLTEALARRDVLALRHGVLRHAAEAAAQAQTRYGRSEIRLVRLIDVAAIRARLDDLARDRRELDTEIQLDGGPDREMTKRESVAATSSGEHQAATAQVALPVHARGTRGWVRIPPRTVTPRTVTSAPGTVTMHNRVLSCAARVGQGTSRG